MSSTPEMTGMDQVQRWHDQMIYFVPAAKQGSYPHPGHPGPGQPVHPMHSVQSMHSVQPGSYVWWPQPFPCELPGVPPTPAVPPAAAPCEAPCPAPCVAVTRETEPKEQGQGCLDASCSTLATPRSTEAPDGSDIVERRLSASAARRLRRKRAAERSRVGAAGGVGAAAGVGVNPTMSIDELRAELRRDPNSGIQCLKGQVWRLSRDANGCRLVQEALELGSRDVTDLANELQGHVLEAVMCPYANYVVQKVVSHLSVAASSFVATELQGNAVRVAKHRFACRIFCRLLEFCGRGPTSQLVDELLARDDGEHENLCSHSFAHHVIQSILEHGEERHKKLIAKMLLSDLWRYATHKNSSYLIEKAICYCSTEDQNQIIAKLGHPQAMLDLAMAQYGSFVARALLSDSRVNSTAALQHIAEHKADVESTKHGHRFLSDVGLEQSA